MKTPMMFSPRRTKCPNCGKELPIKPTHKQECPQCGGIILVRNGDLVTEEQVTIMDWLVRLEGFGITRNYFDKQRDELTKQFGARASVNDTLWWILNRLILNFARNNGLLEQVYREMASLISSEGRDPTQFLIEAENARRRHQGILSIASQKQVFLGHDELKYVRQLRKEGKLDQAEELLLKAETSPAVLDELRKIASTRAKVAKKNGDWQAIIQHLEGYIIYANQWREHCINLVNQAPPEHTESDKKLLQEAKVKLAS
jgi:DNA-directed RNA polymerase subunit RPC12/RpoP